MATGTQAGVGRTLSFQAVHYIRKTVNYNDTGISTGVAMPGQLPAGAQILHTFVNILTAFNAGTTNVLTVGQNSSSYNDIVAAADVDETAVAMTAVTTGGKLVLTSDVTPYIKYAQTGTAATAGKAVVVITYAVNNDG